MAAGDGSSGAGGGEGCDARPTPPLPPEAAAGGALAPAAVTGGVDAAGAWRAGGRRAGGVRRGNREGEAKARLPRNPNDFEPACASACVPSKSNGARARPARLRVWRA